MVAFVTSGPTAAPTEGVATPSGPIYNGRPGALYRIYVTNLLLDVVTLGLHRFWSKTRLRRYHWSRVSYDGDRFEYTGSGRELLKGFALVLTALMPLIAVVTLANMFPQATHPALVFLLNWCVYGFLGYLACVGQYAALRYRLSRTRFRGITAGLAGSPWRYGWLALRAVLLRVFTFGFATPIEDMRLWSYRIRHLRFGTAAAEFPDDTTAHGLFLPYAVYWVTAIGGMAIVYSILESMLAARAAIFAPYVMPDDPSTPIDFEAMLLDPVTRAALLDVVAIAAPVALAAAIAAVFARAFYRARLARRLVGVTSLAGLRFSTAFSELDLGRLHAGNLLILLATLGLGLPFVRHRQWRFFTSGLVVSGRLDGRMIAQARLSGAAHGEGLASVLDAAGAF